MYVIRNSYSWWGDVRLVAHILERPRTTISTTLKNLKSGSVGGICQMWLLLRAFICCVYVCVYVTTSLLVGNRALRGYYASLTRCLSNHFLKEMQKTTRPMKTLLVVKTILNQKCSMPLKNQSIFKAGYCKRNLNLTCFTCMKSLFYEKPKYFQPTFLALQFPEKIQPHWY